MTDKARNDQLEGNLPNLRNLLVNGGFEVWQRGTSFTAAYPMTADEWKAIVTSIGTFSRSINSKTGAYCLQINSTDLTLSALSIRQGIEGWKSLEGLTLTLSAWVKCSVPGFICAAIRDHRGPADVDSALSSCHTGSGNWERLTVVKTIRTGLVSSGAGDFPHGYPLIIDAAHTGPTGGTLTDVFVDGASLVVGNFPGGVPYDLVPSGEDLGRCQRFYYKSKGQIGRHVDGPLVAQNMHTIPFPSPMAAIPTITLSNIVFAGTGTPPLTGTANDLRSWALGLTNLMGPSYAEAQYDVEIAVP